MRLVPLRWSKNLAKYGGRWMLGFMLTIVAIALNWSVISSDSVERLEGFLSGLRMRVEQPVLDKRVVIVDIDERSLDLVGRFPWSRDVQANLVTQLTEHYQVGAVGFDISFPEADTTSGYDVLKRLSNQQLKDVPGFKEQLTALRQEMDYDGLFADALRGKPVVLGYNISDKLSKGVLPKPAFTDDDLKGRQFVVMESTGYEANIARLQEAAAGAGIFTALPDADGVIRSSALLQKIGKGYYPTLSLATAAVYLKARAIFPRLTQSADTMSVADLENGGLDELLMFLPKRTMTIPVGYGLTSTVHFRGPGGPKGGAFRYVSAVDVLTASVEKGVLKDAVVLVGTTAPGLKDIRVTPVSGEYPGVEVHANLIKSMLDDRFKARPADASAIEFLQILLAGLVLGSALAMLSPLKSILLTVLAIVLGAAFNYWMYSAHDAVLNSGVLLILIIGLFVMNVAYGYFFEVRKGQALVSRFGEYVAPELVAEMADNPEKYNMDGESRELTVLFVDVRGFTTISEGLTPKDLREYINLYLTAMSEDIRDSHRGTLDKYIGDAVMAFWGAPVAFPDHASRAVATSLLMQASAQRLDQEFVARGWPSLKIGIGLNTGMMHVGDMGSKIRRAYTVMGDAVNLGSRLEGITKEYGVGIAVGQVTRLAAPEFVYRELDLVRVKGKNEPVAIFEPLGKSAELDPGLLAAIAAWDTALAHVRAQRWDQAEALLRALQTDDPSRKLYSLYLGRIAFYRDHPPGDHWDGVTTFETK